ncbi:MAG: hypothetical protein ACK55Z_17950 [bacterium]
MRTTCFAAWRSACPLCRPCLHPPCRSSVPSTPSGLASPAPKAPNSVIEVQMITYTL